MPVENEIKLRVPDAGSARARIAGLGFNVLHERVHEMNTVCDTEALELRQKRSLVRVRTAGETTTITFKGPPEEGPHKRREETEFTASDADAVLFIFDRLGYRPVFRYEKYRTEFRRDAAPGIVTLDETPIGCFIELEGPAEWVDRTAVELGFTSTEYITESYAGLFTKYSREQGTAATDMLFTK